MKEAVLSEFRVSPASSISRPNITQLKLTFNCCVVRCSVRNAEQQDENEETYSRNEIVNMQREKDESLKGDMSFERRHLENSKN